MNLFAVLVSGVAGVYVICQAHALVAVFDYYFYLLPFALALTSLFLAAGIARVSLLESVNMGVVRAFPFFAGVAMFLGVGLYVFAPSLGSSFFFLSLITAQLIALVLLFIVLVQEGRLRVSLTGVVIGATLGHLLVGEWNMDPLTVTAMAAVFVAVVYLARLLKKGRGVVYGLIVCALAYAVYEGKQQYVMPASLGWVLDVGKAEPGNVDLRRAEATWGQAGLTEVYVLRDDGRAGLVYTNAASPALALTGELTGYDDDWWARNAPLTTAIHDAVRPASLLDIGMAPSEMIWRTAGDGGERRLYGLYGSNDWLELSLPGIGFLGKSVALLHEPDFAMGKKLRLPVDMVVVASGHAGKGGWLSSGAGEQTFLDQENLLAYWQALDKKGVLVLLSQQESVFLRQLFGIWAALRKSGMSDAEFLDHAWAIVPDAMTGASPYRYALVLTKTAKDDAFAEAIRRQVLKLPVRYLFGVGLPPTSPYSVLYQNDMNKVRAVFTQAASQMYGKYVSLEPASSHRSTPYQFVEDVFPQYKNMLVLAVVILLAILIFPLQKYRQVEHLRTLSGPGVAVWLAAGGATGALMAVTLAFLLVYPAETTHESRLLYLAVFSGVTAIAMRASGALTPATRTLVLLAGGGGSVLTLFLVTHFALTTVNHSVWYVLAGGTLLSFLGLALPSLQASLLARGESTIAGWWWFSMAAGCAAISFGSMRLYSALGDALFLIIGPLVIGLAAVVLWHCRGANGPAGREGRGS